MKKPNFLLTSLVLFFASATASTAATLNLKLYIEGYYIGSGQMNPVLFNEGVCAACTTVTDTIIVELHDTVAPYNVIASSKCLLMVDGTATDTLLPNSVIGNSYYIGVKQRSCFETWSAAPVAMAIITSYDFSSAQSQAYAGYMVQVETGRWAFYSGDLNEDGNVDQIDQGIIQNTFGLQGYYAADLNGDGNIDNLDLNYFKDICLDWYSRQP